MEAVHPVQSVDVISVGTGTTGATSVPPRVVSGLVPVVSPSVPIVGIAAAVDTGHTVVEIAILTVTTAIDSAGQSVTVGAQLVIVCSVVV